ncbi:hypothetical protein ACFIJ5_09295 [Haloimpatiens sp. FM7330]|uniref:hypothetical protein n=1 Tax=Haloimpatiens sp. FM7330 TaxID=3298610 RepID=UPI0036275E9A
MAFDPQDFVDKPKSNDFGPYAMNNTEMIEWNGIIIRVPPLELQLEVNERKKQFDRVKAIKEYLGHR